MTGEAKEEERQKLFNKFLDKLLCQFLCCYPVQSIQWHEIPSDITWDEQDFVIQATYKNDLNVKYPLKIAYQLNFLKRLIQELERLSDEVHDAVYESYCDVQRRVAKDLTEKYAYKHYVLTAERASFSLRESKSFVAEGTTGLCSWQASLALADYLLHHKEIVRQRNVMELGAGTGLCGFILKKCCDVGTVLLTDGSVECVRLMRENFVKNFKECAENSDGVYTTMNGEMSIQELSWNDIATNNLVELAKPDILLAADVVYDDSVFDDLSSAVDFVFNLMNQATKMLLAATVRNPHTLEKFLQKLECLNFTVKDEPIAAASESFLHWDRTTPIRILLITREQRGS